MCFLNCPVDTLSLCIPPADVPKTLFGFDAATALEGKPLSEAIDLFGAWKSKFGEDVSLLELLVTQAAKAADVAGATDAGADVGRSRSSPGSSSWRVGVHKPDIDSLLGSLNMSAAQLATTAGSTGEGLVSWRIVEQGRKNHVITC